MFDGWIPNSADRRALKEHDEGASDGVAEDEGSNSPEEEPKLLVWENAIIKQKDGEFDGDHRWIVKDFGGELDFSG